MHNPHRPYGLLVVAFALLAIYNASATGKKKE